MDCKLIEIKQETELIIIDNNFNAEEVEQQLQPQLEQPIICKICKKGFREADLQIHLTTHDDLNNAVLLDRFKNITNKEDSTNFLTLRKSPRHLEEPIKCKICNKGFREEDLQIHLKNCKGLPKKISRNCCKFFKSQTDEQVKHQLTCKNRLRRIAKIQKEYLTKKDWNLILQKTNLLCAICKDTLYEADCDHKLHCLSCIPPRKRNIPKTKHLKLIK